MAVEGSVFTPSKRAIIIFGVLFLVLLTVQMFHREVIIMQRDMHHFETALYDEAQNQLKIEVDYFESEFDYLLTRLAENRYDTMGEKLDLLKDHYLYLDQNTDADEAVLLEFLFRYGDTLALGYGYEIYRHTDTLIYVDDSFEWVALDAVETQLDVSTIEGLLDGTIETGYIIDQDTGFLVSVLEIDDYNVMLVLDLSQLVSAEREYVLERFEHHFNERDDYIFVIEIDGTILLHDVEAHIGENIYTLNDANFEYAFETIIASLEEENQAFSEYPFYIDEQYQEIGTRVAYAVYYETYDLVIAKSLPMSTFDPLIDDFRTTAFRSFLLVTLPIYGLISIAGGFTAFHMYRYAKQTKIVISEEEKIYQKIADMSTQAIIITEPDKGVLFANPNAEKVIGKRKEDYQVPFHQRLVEKEGYFEFIGYQETYFVKMHQEMIRYHNKDAVLYYIEDITDEISRQVSLKEEAYVDPLTQLYNRRKLIEDFAQSILPYVKSGQSASLAIIDFDNFKIINDQLGHDVGDETLTKIANLFKQHENDSVYFYRIGGDEFAVLAKIRRKALSDLLQSVQESVAKLDVHGLKVGFTYGIASIRKDDKEQRFSDYYSKADQALYYYKNVKAQN